MHTWGRSVIVRFTMSDKTFKTIDEQLNILKSRGLTVDNPEKAKLFFAA